MTIDTRELHFFHGTGAKAAASILTDGARNPLDQMEWRSLASDLWSALLDLGSESELFHMLLKYEDLYDGPGLTALRSASLCEDNHLFIYGHFFATLNIGNAYRYTVRNPFRSEFLMAISTGLQLLARRGAASTAQDIEIRYPDILDLINNPPPPVVIELIGIDESRLSNENGSKPVAPQIGFYLDTADKLGVSVPASFRIHEVTPRDVIAVHDLREWSPDDILRPPWIPDRGRVEAARKNPEQWLSSLIEH